MGQLLDLVYTTYIILKIIEYIWPKWRTTGLHNAERDFNAIENKENGFIFENFDFSFSTFFLRYSVFSMV